MSKAHKIFYQGGGRKKPFALEIHVFYSFPKVFEIEGGVYHENLPHTVKCFCFSTNCNFPSAFDKVWNEVVVPASECHKDFTASKSDYHLMRAEFEKLLETNMCYNANEPTGC